MSAIDNKLIENAPAEPRSMRDVGFAIGMLAILAVLFVPIPTFLIDFGLAKSSGDRMLTEVGTLLGTPAFMSPEQISARDLDSRTDQFSLGLTVRFAATGETAFPKLGGVQLLAALSTRPVEFPANLSPVLRRCLTRMTRIQPERRYSSVRALLRDLSSPIDPVACG